MLESKLNLMVSKVPFMAERSDPERGVASAGLSLLHQTRPSVSPGWWTEPGSRRLHDEGLPGGHSWAGWA